MCIRYNSENRLYVSVPLPQGLGETHIDSVKSVCNAIIALGGIAFNVASENERKTLIAQPRPKRGTVARELLEAKPNNKGNNNNKRRRMEETMVGM